MSLDDGCADQSKGWWQQQIHALALQSALRRRILSTWLWMNFCPPKPGLTLMMSTRSTMSMTCSRQHAALKEFLH